MGDYKEGQVLLLEGLDQVTEEEVDHHDLAHRRDVGCVEEGHQLLHQVGVFRGRPPAEGQLEHCDEGGKPLDLKGVGRSIHCPTELHQLLFQVLEVFEDHPLGDDSIGHPLLHCVEASAFPTCSGLHPGDWPELHVFLSLDVVHMVERLDLELLGVKVGLALAEVHHEVVDGELGKDLAADWLGLPGFWA